ncbi:hypothetical protein ABIA32_002727 [Streptacidiphilus sp. MAP12-20]|uniref:hypothetical protein n=1 Tax=Streptacidiphilus sp. MAP12-20 TaxID=3156299 RepID=UPI0035198050
MTGHHVTVWGIESGPGHPVGRVVEVDGEDIGVAVSLIGLLVLLEEHDVYGVAGITWHDGGPEEWP